MNILLFDAMVLAEGLTNEQAVDALKKASQHPLADKIKFTIQSSPDFEGHRLCGTFKKWEKKFLENPKDFLIKI